MSSAEQPDSPGLTPPPEPFGSSDTDRSIFERIQQGHRDALSALLDRYWASLVGYAAGITGDRDVAQDVAQETFVQIWVKRLDWESTGTPRAYLFRIARNLALNARRDRALRQSRHEGAADELLGLSPPTPADDLEADSLLREIQAAIAELPERRREAFLLARFPGLTHREIAETMGISLQTVSNQMSAALAQLRVALAHHLED